MFLKEKKVQRQQMLQFMVEFCCKAFSKQQKVTIIDATRVVGVMFPRRMTRTVRMRNRRVPSKTDLIALALP